MAPSAADPQTFPCAITADGWLDPVKRCPSPNFDQRPLDTEISLLVVHGISLPPGQFGGGYIEAFFSNALPVERHPYFQEIAELKVSAHCLVDREGAVTQFVSFDQRAWHAGRSCFEGRSACNDFSVGIELEGEDLRPYTVAQYTALAELIKLLMARYPALTPERVVGHSDVAPGRKTDPGPSFDWTRLRQALATC